jgi:hypothetical protein
MPQGAAGLSHSACWQHSTITQLTKVMEGMLGNIRHAQVGVAPNSARAGLVFARDDLDERLHV